MANHHQMIKEFIKLINIIPGDCRHNFYRLKKLYMEYYGYCFFERGIKKKKDFIKYKDFNEEIKNNNFVVTISNNSYVVLCK